MSLLTTLAKAGEEILHSFEAIEDMIQHTQSYPPTRALFVLKLREDYSQETLVNFDKQQVATGMFNSATFVSDMLNSQGIAAKVVVVVDNNCIDREVTAFGATHVFIEGYWVVPEKFSELIPLHPDTDWIVRCHSEIPFLAQEGIALDWTYGYLKRGVKVAGNSPRIVSDLRVIANQIDNEWTRDTIEIMCPYLPNYYPIDKMMSYEASHDSDYLDIGCFGAIRPLKNHLMQAIGAIRYADSLKKKLRFHVNQGRIEMNGANTIKNLKALFAGSTNHELVEHPWTGHDEFLTIIRGMDLCMQVSFTETFNIVTADAVSVGVPVVMSPEIWWASGPFASPNDSVDIFNKLQHIHRFAFNVVHQNQEDLRIYSRGSVRKWLEYF